MKPYLGEIRIFAGRSDALPAGWVLCNGQRLVINDYPELYQLIGNIYGFPESGTFAVPNITGRAALGYGSGPGLTPRTSQGQKLGTSVAAISPTEMPSHNHQLVAGTFAAQSSVPAANSLFAEASDGYAGFMADGAAGAAKFAFDKVVQTAGSAGPDSPPRTFHPNMMPSLAINYMICAGGGVMPTPADFAPIITSIWPDNGPHVTGGGVSKSQITISGYNFPNSPQKPTVLFGDMPATVISSTVTQIVVLYPEGNGTVPVTVSGPNGQSSVNQGSYFGYWPSILWLDPPTGSPLDKDPVRIHGVGLATTEAVWFGAAGAKFGYVSNDMVEVYPPPQAIGTASVTVGVRLEDQSVSAATPGCVFNYAPRVSSISPDFGAPGGGTLMTLKGENFSKGCRVAIGSPIHLATYISPTELQVDTPPGTGVVEVLIIGPVINKSYHAGSFSYLPVVTSISAVSGMPGTLVTLFGDNFTDDPTIYFGTTPAEINGTASPTAVEVIVPAGPQGSVPITLTTAGGSSDPARIPMFNYAPFIDSISPPAGSISGGETVTITGGSFPDRPVVTFAGYSVLVLSATTTSIVVQTPSYEELAANLPAGTYQCNVQVVGGGNFSPITDFTFFTYGLAVTSLDSQWGVPSGGDLVNVYGYGFAASGTLTIMFGSAAAELIEIVNDTALTCSWPAGTGTVNVQVTIVSGSITTTSPASAANAFFYFPSIESIVPESGSTNGGTKVTASGQNFVKDGTSILVGGQSAKNVVVQSPYFLSFITPACSGPGLLDISTVGGWSTGPQFTGLPYVSGLSRHSAKPSPLQSIDVYGGGFLTATDVYFGTTPAKFRIQDDGLISVEVPTGLYGSTNVQVTASFGGTSAISSATYFSFGPLVTSISQVYGASGGGTPITISGQGFNQATNVVFGNVPALSYAIVDDTTMTAVSPPGTDSVKVVVVAGEANSLDSNPATTTFNYGPVITAVVSDLGLDEAMAGAVVKIAVSGMLPRPPGPEAPSAWINGFITSEMFVFDFYVRLKLPANLQPGTCRIALSNGYMTSNSYAFTIV